MPQSLAEAGKLTEVVQTRTVGEMKANSIADEATSPQKREVKYESLQNKQHDASDQNATSKEYSI